MPSILLVEDDDEVRKFLRLSLLKMGHTVAEARNGKEAIARQLREPAELLLTDVIMPEKEGLETIQEFRLKFPKVRIIAMSGGGRVSAMEYLRIAKAMGAHQVLAKPFSGEELLFAITNAKKL